MSSPLVSLPGGLSFFSGSPGPVTDISYTITGTKGSTTYFYWVVANYIWGNVAPIAPLQVSNAPDVLGGGNAVVLNWNAPNSQVQSYTVARSTVPVFPGNLSLSAVGFGFTVNTTITDSGGALGTLTFTPISTIQAVMYIDGTGPTPILISTVGQQINGSVNASGNVSVGGSLTASGGITGVSSWKVYNVSWDGVNWETTSTGNPTIFTPGAAALTQDITLISAVPSNFYVEAVRFVTVLQQTGGGPTTLVLANVGMGGVNNFFVSGATYNLKLATSPTNFVDFTPSPGGVGGATLSRIGANTQAGGSPLTVTIVSTGSNINTIPLNCAFKVAVKWGTIPQN